jgi:hypothetical protein
MIALFETMHYPHWLMVAGAALVVLGFIGFAFRQNRNGLSDREAKPKGEIGQ